MAGEEALNESSRGVAIKTGGVATEREGVALEKSGGDELVITTGVAKGLKSNGGTEFALRRAGLLVGGCSSESTRLALMGVAVWEEVGGASSMSESGSDSPLLRGVRSSMVLGGGSTIGYTSYNVHVHATSLLYANLVIVIQDCTCVNTCVYKHVYKQG